jgi:hypothetical protein
LSLAQQLEGSKVRSEVGAKNEYPSIRSYIWSASGGSTYGPTPSHKKYLVSANKMYNELSTKLKNIQDALVPLADQLKEIGAPQIKN